jgi:hypothetical protein
MEKNPRVPERGGLTAIEAAVIAVPILIVATLAGWIDWEEIKPSFMREEQATQVTVSSSFIDALEQTRERQERRAERIRIRRLQRVFGGPASSDLNCDDPGVGTDIPVGSSDPNGFDADSDGIGCES